MKLKAYDSYNKQWIHIILGDEDDAADKADYNYKESN